MRFAALRPCARVLAGLGMAVLFPVLTGCGPGTGTVSGKVTYKGQPVPGGLVTFRPADPSKNAITVFLGEDGRYPAVTLPTGDVTVIVDNRDLEPRPAGGIPSMPAGIPLSAEAKAKMKAPPPPPKAAEPAPEDPAAPRKPSGRYVPIPEKYYMLETTDLKFTVKAGEQTQDLELKD